MKLFRFRKPSPTTLLVVADMGHPGRLSCLKLLSGKAPREYDSLKVVEIISATDPAVVQFSVNHGERITTEVRYGSFDKGAIAFVQFVVADVPDELS